MTNFIRTVAAFAVVVLSSSVAMAQDAVPTVPHPLINLTGAFAPAWSRSAPPPASARLAAAAVESMARQPEVAGTIQTAMIIAAALIEGFTFFALYICMIG